VPFGTGNAITSSIAVHVLSDTARHRFLRRFAVEFVLDG
jgi:hypothetical protein